MAFGALSSGGSSRFEQYEGRITIYVVFASILAATSALMSGYDAGITGGVAQMNSFLQKFFPAVYANKQLSRRIGNTHSIYCQYSSQTLQVYSASISLASALSTLFASYFTRNYGRRPSLLFAGICFMIGVILKASAQNFGTLLVGRIIIGWGLGFGLQAAPIYLSEIAPFKWRGSLNFFFQVSVGFGNLIAYLINYGNGRTGNGFGWRISLGLAGIPAVLITLGALLICDSPNSLVQRGYEEEGKKMLQRIRGTKNVEIEFEDILIAAKKLPKEDLNAQQPDQLDSSKTTSSISFFSSLTAFQNLLKSKTSRPPLIVSCVLQFFVTFATGSFGILFYTPILFSTFHFSSDATLFWSVILGIILVLGAMTGSGMVDRLGRKQLLVACNFFMFVCLIGLAILLSTGIRDGQNLSHSLAPALVLLMYGFISAYAVSWAPLVWLIPSEIFPLETRSAGLSITVSVRCLFDFLTLETSLSMLCAFKWGLFLFFAAWVALAQVFVVFFLPETKGVPIEEMDLVWRRHWFWKMFTLPPLEVNYEENSPKKQDLDLVPMATHP